MKKLPVKLKWPVFALTALLLILCLFFSIIRTELGMTWLFRFLNRSVAEGSIRVEVKNPGGIFPFSFSFDRLTVSDKAGVFLTVNDVTSGISGLSLLKGRLHIKDLSAESVILKRLPRTEKDASPGINRQEIIPGFLFHTKINRLLIRRFEFPVKSSDRPAAYRILMRLSGDRVLKERSLDFKARGIDGSSGNIAVEAAAKGAVNPRLKITAIMEEDNGLITGIPGAGGKTGFLLEGEGPVTDWKGVLRGNAGSLVSIDSKIEMEIKNVPEIRLAGSLDLSGKLFSKDAEKTPRLDIDFLIETLLKKDRLLEISRLRLEALNSIISLKGALGLKDLSVGGSYDIESKDISRAGLIFKRKISGNALLKGNFSGTLFEPEIASGIKVTGLKTDRFEAEETAGSLTLKFSNNRAKAGRNIHIEGNGKFENACINREQDKFFGTKAGLTFDIDTPSPDSYKLNRFSISWDDTSLSGSAETGPLKEIISGRAILINDPYILEASGSFNLRDNTVDSVLSMDVSDLNTILPLQGSSLKGSGRLKAEVKGPLNNLRLNLETAIKDFTYKKIDVPVITAAVDASGNHIHNQGKIELYLKSESYRINGTSLFKTDNRSLSFSKMDISSTGIKINGHLNRDMGNDLWDGRLEADCRDIEGIASFLGEDIHGRISIAGDFRSENQDIDIDLKFSGSGIESRFGNAESLTGEAVINGPFISPDVNSSINIKNAGRGSLTFDDIRAQVNGTAKNADFKISSSGSSDKNFYAEMSGSYFQDKDRQVLKLADFNGAYGSLPVKLVKPLVAEKRDDTLKLDETELNFDQGIIKSHGKLTRNEIDLSVAYRDIHLGSLSFTGIPWINGSSTGNLSLEGSLSAPVLRNKMDVNFIKVPPEEEDVLPPLKAKIFSIVESGRFRTNISMDDKSTGVFKGSLDIPLNLSIWPFSWALDREDKIKGSFSGDIELAKIPPLTDFTDHVMNGGLKIDINLYGTPLKPEITGQARLKDGGYECLKTGTILRDIEMDISAEPPRIRINKITASDGMGGKVSGTGWMDAEAETGFPCYLKFDLENFTLAKNDIVNILSGGQAVLSGSLDGYRLSGNLDVRKTELSLPDRLPPEVTEYDVKEINTDRSVAADEHARPGKIKVKPVKLDLAADSPGKIHISGRGLTSEWKGGLEIRGYTDSPSIEGRLTIQRGYYILLGKRFQLTRGDIYFDGKIPASPVVNITGETVSNDIKVYVIMEGDIGNPEIKLESDPHLPADEIFSRLLFGRSASQITPVQAIQLANAVNGFLKGGKRNNLLEKTRKLLMVDQLEFKQSGNNMRDSTLSAGKYISDNIYLQVEQGFGSDSGSASIKWELTPNITVETEISEKNENGAGINWKKDY